jgi:hypothetical protein
LKGSNVDIDGKDEASGDEETTVAAASICSKAEGGRRILSPVSDFEIRDEGVAPNCAVHVKET